MLALRAASHGLCGGRSGSAHACLQPPPPSPPPLHTGEIVDVKTTHREEHRARERAVQDTYSPIPALPSAQPVACGRKGAQVSSGNLTSLLVDGWLLVDVGIRAGGLCGEGARADEKEDVLLAGEAGSVMRMEASGMGEGKKFTGSFQ